MSFCYSNYVGDGKKKTLLSFKKELPYISKFEVKIENKNFDTIFYTYDDTNNPFCIYSLDINKIKQIYNAYKIKYFDSFFEVNEGGIKPDHI